MEAGGILRTVCEQAGVDARELIEEMYDQPANDARPSPEHLAAVLEAEKLR